MDETTEKPKAKPRVETGSGWRDDRAPREWENLTVARNASGAWYDGKYLPPKSVIAEWVRRTFEYGLFVASMGSGLAILDVARFYESTGAATPLWLNATLNWIQVIMLFVFGPYMILISWLGRRKMNESVAQATVPAKQAARVVESLGGWGHLGEALDRTCGGAALEPPRLTRETLAKSALWVIPAIVKLGLIRTAHDVQQVRAHAGQFLSIVALFYLYFLFQFFRVLRARDQSRRPEKHSPCTYLPLRVLLAELREKGRVLTDD